MMIVMPTSNGHVPAAEISAAMLAKRWPAHPPLCVLHHEARPSIEHACLHFAGAQSSVSWLRAMTEFLRSRDEPRFLLLLDDYAVCSSPDFDAITRAERLIAEDPAAGMHALCWYPGSALRRPVLLQAAIWDREWFLKLAAAVHPDCSPWGFEGAATQAAKLNPRTIHVPAIDALPGKGSGRFIDGLDKSNWPLPYHNLMHRGQWAPEHIDWLIEQKVDFPSRGLGDVLAKIFRATGLDHLSPKNCGCAERREKLNEIAPFG